MIHTLTLEQLRTATEAGGVASVNLQAQGAEFFLQIKTRNNGEAILARARSTAPRAFRNPVLAITLLRKLGIVLGTFDLTQWNPDQGSVSRVRPDRAAAMKRAHAAVEHDKWFRAQVAQGLEEADNPATEWVTHDLVKEDMAIQRATLLARIKGATR